MTIADTAFKAAEVDLAQRALTHIAADIHTVVLLVIAGEVLHGDVVALLLLDTLDNGGGHSACQIGVFGEILEVSAAEGIAVDVDGGCQPVGTAVLLHLAEDGVAHLTHQRFVPALGEGVGHRESGGVLIEHLTLLGVAHHELADKFRQGVENTDGHLDGLYLALLVHHGDLLDAEACRAIAHGYIGKAAIPEFRGGVAHRTGQREAGFRAVEACAHNDVRHLFQGQGIQQRLHTGLGADGGRFVTVGYRFKGGGVNGDTGQVGGQRFRFSCGGFQFLQRLTEGADMRMAGDDDFLLHRQHAHRDGIAGGVAQTEDVRSFFQHEIAIALTVRGHVLQIEGQRQRLGGAGCEGIGLFKGGEGLVFLVEVACGGRHIQLRHLLAAIIAARVGDGGGDGDDTAIHRNTAALDSEVGIAQTEAEGERRGDREGIEVAVAHVDALSIILVLQVAVEVAIVASEGDVGVLLCPCIGQLARGGHIAGEDVGKSVTTLSAQLAEVDDGVDALDFLHKAHVDGRARVDDQHEVGILLGAEADGGQLLIGEEEVPLLRLAVAALACLAAHHIHTAVGIGGRYIAIVNHRAAGGAEVLHQHVHNGVGLQNVNALFLLYLVSGLRFNVEPLKIGDPVAGSDRKTAVGHALQNSDGVALVHLARACAALDGHGSTCAIESHLLRLKRQRAVIFQQHDALTGSAVGHLQVLLFALGHFIGIGCFR